MNKAFTREDDDAGFEPPPRSVTGPGRVRLTATGARLLAASPAPGHAEVAAHADVLSPQLHPDRAAIGVTVRTRTADGDERAYRLVTSDERSLLGEGCSVEGPIGRALLGARAGDVVEVVVPRGAEELEVIALDGEDPD